MVEVFRGEADQKVDQKGRVYVPNFFRRVIERGDPECGEGERPSLVLVYGTEKQKQLKCFTIRGIRSIDRRIRKMKKGSVERRAMEKIYNGLAQPVQLDDEGRITLPQKLRDKLDLNGRAYMIANSDHFELWKPETYTGGPASKEVDDWIEAQGEDFDPDSVLPDDDDDEDDL